MENNLNNPATDYQEDIYNHLEKEEFRQVEDNEPKPEAEEDNWNSVDDKREGNLSEGGDDDNEGEVPDIRM